MFLPLNVAPPRAFAGAGASACKFVSSSKYNTPENNTFSGVDASTILAGRGRQNAAGPKTFF
jgi:hypothetical protein